MTLFFTLLEELFVQIAYKLIDLNLWLPVFSGFGWSGDTDGALIELIEQPPALLGTDLPSLLCHLPLPPHDIIVPWQTLCFPGSSMSFFFFNLFKNN